VIDSSAFAEWIVAKAEAHHGAPMNDRNMRAAQEAVERAIRGSAEEIVVTCTLDGANGPVTVEERLTRMAVENLFAKVHVSAKKAPPHDERARPARARRDEEERAERETQRAEDARFKRRVLVTLVAIAVMIAGGVISMVIHEEHQERIHEKREGR